MQVRHIRRIALQVVAGFGSKAYCICMHWLFQDADTLYVFLQLPEHSDIRVNLASLVEFLFLQQTLQYL